MKRYLKLVVSAILAQPKLFLVLFGALALYTWALHAKNPLGPGQDYHFHLMVASINGRGGSDPVRALYGTIDPTTTNTLLYTLAWPFEKLFSPVRAFQITVTLFYFLGFPLSCAVALRRIGRPPWGALLAFPLAYFKDWSQNGFMPFLLAAPFMVLAIGEFQVAQTSTGVRRRRAVIACAIFAVCTFLAHGHVYVWATGLLALLTLVRIGTHLRELALRPKAALLAAFESGVVALAIITPSLVLFGRWLLATHHGSQTASSNQGLQPVDWPMIQRLNALPGLLAPAVGDRELVFIPVLALLVLTCWMLVPRRLDRPAALSFEICFVVTLISFFVLPLSFAGGQSLAVRHLSLALWLLPLVVFESDPPRLRPAHALAIAAVALFAFVRVRAFGEQLRASNEDEFKGLLPLARTCAKTIPPGKTGELAYAAMGRYSKYWRETWSLHQVHETFAAVCNLDTPVYDTSIYPHNFLPLRYKGKLPAPITILSGDPYFYQRGLFRDFEYLLVQGWTVPQAEAEKLLPQAELVARSGDFQLWKRK